MKTSELKTISKSQQAGIAIVVGLAVALVAKFIYDLFNGYATIQDGLIRLNVHLSMLGLEIFQFIAMVLAAFIVGRVLRSALPMLNYHYGSFMCSALGCVEPSWFNGIHIQLPAQGYVSVGVCDAFLFSPRRIHFCRSLAGG